jgi:putative flippase GtrA
MASVAERAPERTAPAQAVAPAVDVVVPVRDEAHALEASIRRLHAYLTTSFPFSFRITIADNGSRDGTWEIARALAADLEHVRAVKIDGAGRGRALESVWSESNATVLAYMDVDLSTDLAALLPLVAPILSGHSDVAIGTRLSRSARVVRGAKRELISRIYNFLLRVILRVRFSDAQCGFKAVSSRAARKLLPLVHDRGWFFDTELLVLAERMGLRIHEVPVDWTDDADSRVDIVSTALADLRGVARLSGDLLRGRMPVAESRGPAPSFASQVIRFVAIGIASTLAYLLLYLVFRKAVGAQVANALALVTTAIANTAANRRLTFAVRGRACAVRHQAQGLVVFGIALGLTSGALAALHLSDPDASRRTEVIVLVAANLVATIVRFVLLRSWVFRARRTAP